MCTCSSALITQRAEEMSEMYGYPWNYEYATDGFFFVARSFALTDDIRERILSTLDRATLQCTAVEGEVVKLVNVEP